MGEYAWGGRVDGFLMGRGEHGGVGEEEKKKEGDTVGERQQRLYAWARLVVRRYSLEEGQA